MLTSQSSEEDLTMWMEPLWRHIDKDMPTFLSSCFLIDDVAEIQNALKLAWPEDEVLVYLCTFHIIKNWKSHLLSKVPDLGNLQTLVYTTMHDFLYTLIKYKEIESAFLNCINQLGDSFFQFLYVDKMKAYFDTYYSHQGNL